VRLKEGLRPLGVKDNQLHCGHWRNETAASDNTDVINLSGATTMRNDVRIGERATEKNKKIMIPSLACTYMYYFCLFFVSFI
jgi:hypothetical protein